MNPSEQIPNSEEILRAMSTDSSIQKEGTTIVEKHGVQEVANSPLNAGPPYKQFLIPQPSRQQSIIKSHSFPYLRMQREAEARKKRVQLTNISTPHDHDILCGRGNLVNRHQGNQYYRSLVRKYFVQYVASPKPDKPKYALLIYHDIRMQDPPGRFLRLERGAKTWYDVGERKALDKTRQALREGAPDAKNVGPVESLKYGNVFKTNKNSLAGNVNAPSCGKDPLSSINCAGYEVTKKAEHFNSSKSIIPQAACAQIVHKEHSLSETYNTNGKPQQSNIPLLAYPHVHRQSQASKHSPDGSQCQKSTNQLSCATPHAQQELQLNTQTAFQLPHAKQCGQNNHSSYGPHVTHKQNQQSNQSSFELLRSQQNFQQSNISPSKAHITQQQDQQNNQSSCATSYAQQQQHKQSGQSNFEPQQYSQSDQSSFEIPHGHMNNVNSNETSSFINAVASEISESIGVPHDDNLLKMILAITASANGGLAGDESLVDSVASKIAAAKGVDTNGSLEKSVIPRLQSPDVAKCVGAKIIALLNEVLRVDDSILNPPSLTSTTGTKTSTSFPVSSTSTNKSVAVTEISASKATDDVNATDTTFRTPTVNMKPYCCQTKTVTAANVHVLNDSVSDITTASKVAHPDHSLANTNVLEIIPKSNTITSGTAQLREILTNESHINAIDLSIAVQTSKQARAKGHVVESKKRRKTSNAEHPSVVKDLAAVLLAMSNGDDRKSQDASFDEGCGSDGNSIDKTIPQTSTTFLLNGNQRKRNPPGNISWSSASLGNIMQCDRCLGAGTLPMPPSALSSLQYTPKDNSTCGTSMFAGINLNSSLRDQPKNSIPVVKIEDEESKASDITSNELEIFFPDWTERICNAEKKWGIQHDDSQPYFQRIKAIEKKNLEYREAFHCSNTSSRVLEGEKRYLEKVEDAEKKWGLSAPERFNLAKRIEMVEDVISSYNMRLHNCL